MNEYIEMKSRHQQEVNDFPMFFAFSDKQFDDGMKSFGLQSNETDKIYKLGSTGGFYLRTDAARLHEMFDRHEKEMSDEIENDPTGDGFIFDMFYYELSNHEYTYTGSVESAIAALGFSWDDIEKSEKLLHGLSKAKKSQWDYYNQQED